MKCPAGHKLPHFVGKMECTPLKCAARRQKEKRLRSPPPRQKPRKPAPEVVDEVDPADVPPVQAVVPQVDDENRFLVSALEARRRLVPVPVLSPEDDPHAITEARAGQLLPEALAEVEYQMRFGDQRARIDAARDILDMTGMRRKDALAGGGQTIILNIAGGARLPWEKPKELIDATFSQGATDAGEAEPSRSDGDGVVGGLLQAAGGRGPSAGGASSEPDADEAVDVV